MSFGSALAKALLLAAVATVTYVPTASVAYLLGGSPGLLAATAAAGLCLLGAIVPVMIPSRLVAFTPACPMLAGMVARMGIPICGGLALHLSVAALASAGVLYYLLVFYPPLLAAQAWLCLPEKRRDGSH
jgi:hypothetical protein